ncbi:exodeoxyribonuclease VII small subunit [Limosilactobacillus ingluviei]|uniref:Exodeoxyribonuclease 7 small subunit n=1 Tax=Limosilactobacillus ingluviei TaxID=148604 RepID=A0A0R2GXA8_9LACO|nr:exodeoxyribonuclease VII small subunit [Limosilactobacillus ingluviei]KRN45360.1 hypothetical protein IV41_GL001101 [Limosilactobacillus ingluviei]
MATKQADATFEEQMAQLQTIVGHLQNGQLSLDDSIKEFQTGMQLAQAMQMQLDHAQATLAQLVDENGNMQAAEQAGDDLSNNGVQNQGYRSEFARPETD